MSKGRWLNHAGLCLSLFVGAPSRRPAAPSAAPPSGLPILKRELSEYVAKHPAEFQKLANKTSNWEKSSGTAETAFSIPDEVLTGAGGCTLSAPLTITPAQNTHLFKHFKKGQSVPPSDVDDPAAAHGVIVARIINPTNCTAAPVGFGPGTYYWIVRGVGAGASRTYESVFVHAEDLSDTIKVHFDRCANPDHPQPDDSADSFLLSDVCTDAITQSVPHDPAARARYTEKVRGLIARAAQSGRGARKRRFDDDIALWIACDQGCCYASGF